MTESLEPILKKALENIDAQKTAACIDVGVLGLYIEGKLSYKEAVDAEEHINSCLFCLNQVVELKELLYLRHHSTPLSPQVHENIMALFPKKPEPEKKSLRDVLTSLIQTIYHFLSITSGRWRYAAVPVAAVATLVIVYVLLSHLTFGPEKPRQIAKLPGEKDSTFSTGFSSDRSSKTDKEAQHPLAIHEAKAPIILETQNVEDTFESVKKIIQSHNGKLIDFSWKEGEIAIVFNLRAQEEGPLFSELGELGTLRVEREGFRDKKGDVVLFLKEKKM